MEDYTLVVLTQDYRKETHMFGNWVPLYEAVETLTWGDSDVMAVYNESCTKKYYEHLPHQEHATILVGRN